MSEEIITKSEALEKVLGNEINELPDEQQENIFFAFSGLLNQAQVLRKKAAEIQVTDENQSELMKAAKELRKEIRNVRLSAENTKKKLKRQYLLLGRALDGMQNLVLAICEPAEAYLYDQEKFAEIREKERIEQLIQQRIAQVTPLFSDLSAEDQEKHLGFYNFGEMSEDNFNILLSNLRTNFETRKAARLQEEEKRVKEEAERQERIRKIEEENLRLKKEAVEKEKYRLKISQRMAALANVETFINFDEAEKFTDATFRKFLAERQKAFNEKLLQIQKEREEKEAIEKEAQRLRDAEQRRLDDLRKQKEQDDKKAREKDLAPDKEKLLELAKEIQNYPLPVLTCEEANVIINNTRNLLGKVSTYLIEKANQLK